MKSGVPCCSNLCNAGEEVVGARRQNNFKEEKYLRRSLTWTGLRWVRVRFAYLKSGIFKIGGSKFFFQIMKTSIFSQLNGLIQWFFTVLISTAKIKKTTKIGYFAAPIYTLCVTAPQLVIADLIAKIFMDSYFCQSLQGYSESFKNLFFFFIEKEFLLHLIQPCPKEFSWNSQL